MDPKQILNEVKLFFKQLPARMKNSSLGEKIAYGVISFGALLILIALVLF